MSIVDKCYHRKDNHRKFNDSFSKKYYLKLAVKVRGFGDCPNVFYAVINRMPYWQGIVRTSFHFHGKETPFKTCFINLYSVCVCVQTLWQGGVWPGTACLTPRGLTSLTQPTQAVTRQGVMVVVWCNFPQCSVSLASSSDIAWINHSGIDNKILNMNTIWFRVYFITCL